jgi:hypothetical protein
VAGGASRLSGNRDLVTAGTSWPICNEALDRTAVDKDRKHAGVGVQTGRPREQMSEADGKHARAAAIAATAPTTRFCAPGLNNYGVADPIQIGGYRALILSATRRCNRVYAGSLWRWFSPAGPVVVARCEDGWSVGRWSGGWRWAGLGPVAGEVGLAGQGGPAEDGGEFCCLGSLAFPFGLDGREH